ncbi:MAG TPA: hypothetical protein VL944_03165 [Candidatus Acidoferrum sp.]|nr:hypothetical protein [Candidatus Acidoferrum sp.]
MRGKTSGGGALALRLRARAAAALKESEVSDIFSELGMTTYDESASSALKAILAEKTAEYTMRAMKEAKKRGMRFGAAALIIAAEKDRW